MNEVCIMLVQFLNAGLFHGFGRTRGVHPAAVVVTERARGPSSASWLKSTNN